MFDIVQENIFPCTEHSRHPLFIPSLRVPFRAVLICWVRCKVINFLIIVSSHQLIVALFSNSQPPGIAPTFAWVMFGVCHSYAYLGNKLCILYKLQLNFHVDFCFMPLLGQTESEKNKQK